MLDIAARVRTLRAERNMTQEDLSRESGIERDKIAKIEVGDRKVGATELAFLADALGVSMKSLLVDSEPAVMYRKAEPKSAEAQRAMAWFEQYTERSSALRVMEQEFGWGRT